MTFKSGKLKAEFYKEFNGYDVYEVINPDIQDENRDGVIGSITRDKFYPPADDIEYSRAELTAIKGLMDQIKEFENER